jgi:hypothetical protein
VSSGGKPKGDEELAELMNQVADPFLNRFGIRWGLLSRFSFLDATFVVIYMPGRAARARAVATPGAHWSDRLAEPAHRALNKWACRERAPRPRHGRDHRRSSVSGQWRHGQHVGGLRNQSRNLMPPTPHNDLHPTARDHAQKEGCEESQCDCRVKHCHSPCETPVFRSRPRSGDVLDHHFPDVAALAV